MKINKIDRIYLSGGLLGALFTNPRAAIDSRVEEANQNGWNLHQLIPHRETNLFMQILSLVVLVATLFMWTFGAGYLLVFEKKVVN